LEVKINDVSTSEKEVEISYTYDEIKNDIDNEVKKRSKKIQVPGFRKGKVPPAMIKKMFGDSLEHEASEKVANSLFWDIAKEKELKPIGQPVMTDIKFHPGEEFSFKVKYEVIPELDIKDYRDQEIEVPDLQVKDEDVEHEIFHIKRANSTTEDTAIVGDDNNCILHVEILRINEDGNPYNDAKPEEMDIDLTEEKINKEIIENAKGKKTGESFNFSFKQERKEKNAEGNEETISENFIYKAEIKSIKKIVLPELTEELIKKVTKDKVATEEDFRNDIRKDIQNYYDQTTEKYTRDKLTEKIINNNKFTAPNSLVDNLLDDFVQKEEQYYKKQGYNKIDKDLVRERYKNNAEFEVKWYLLRNAIIKEENLDVPDEELREMAKKDAENSGLTEDKLFSYYKSTNFKEQLLDKKLFDFLKMNNQIKKVDKETLEKKEAKENK